MSGIIYQSELASLQLLLIPLFCLLYYLLEKKRREMVRTYINLEGKRPLRASHYRMAKVLFLLFAYVAGVIALMQPEVRKSSPGAAQDAISEVAFVLDVSQSMATLDGNEQKESRLARAKEIAQQIVQAIGGVNVSLSIFQGDTEFVVPSTLDYLYFQFALHNLTTESTAVPGTNFSSMVAAMKEKILDDPMRKKMRIVCLTDGEDTALMGLSSSEEQARKEHLVRLLNEFRAADIAWSMIGVGTVAGGKVPEEAGAISHLTVDTLNMFRDHTHGSVQLSQDIQLQDIVDGVVAELNQGPDIEKTQYTSLLFYPLLIACLCLLLHLFCPDEVRYE